jgi:pSer/pThr/pTyr-binding forkhead associated (FHA) protein
MTEKNPNDEQNHEPLDEAMPTQMMPEPADLDASVTNEFRVISFYLPSRSEPLVSRDATITIGRRDPKRKINPTIDLTEERGAQLGVSRLHVEINYQNSRYYLKDMGSANGTWVNNSKLVPYQPHPIETGDQIRLGQLALLIHITTPQRGARSTSQKLVETITDSSYSFRVTTSSNLALVQAMGGFAPSILDGLADMMRNVERIFYIVREAQQQDAEGFSIVRIRTEPLEGAILFDVKGGADVLNFIMSKMPDFVKVLQGGEAVAMSADMEKAMEIAHIDQYDTIAEQVAEYALQELVFKFLEDNRKTYVQQLAPYLDRLISGALEIRQTS